MQQQDGRQQQGIRWHLRQVTAAKHEEVDALGSAFPLNTPQGYRRFLRAHARALPAVEQGLEDMGIGSLLPDWPERSRRAALGADLAALGIAAPPALPFAPPAGPAAALGAAYVLEGSRFGNGMLLRQVQQAGNTCAPAATAYLAHKASWPDFLARLEQQLADPALWPGAAEGALATFACFHAALAAEQAEEPLLHA